MIINKNQSQTRGHATTLEIKKYARVMLTSNIDIDDRLINWQKVLQNSQMLVSKIYVELDDKRAGVKIMNTDNFAKERGWVPIDRIAVNIKVKSSKDSSPVIKRTISINAFICLYCA